MSRRYKIRDQGIPHFVSIPVVDWIDLFTRIPYKDIIVDSLAYCQKAKGLIIYAWVIMPNHLHLIIGTEKNPMQDILRDFKRHTSKELREVIEENMDESRRRWILQRMIEKGTSNGNNNEWQLWQQHNHPIELATNEMLDTRFNYLHQNPVKAGFVEEPEHWRYSSAVDYANRRANRGWLELVFID